MNSLAFSFDLIDRPALQRRPDPDISLNLTNSPHAIAPSASTGSRAFAARQQKYDVKESGDMTTHTRTMSEPAPIHQINDREFARIVSDALWQHYGPMKSTAKRIANDCGASVGTARNWLDALCPPSSVYLKRLEAKVPRLAAEMRRLTALEADLNPDFQRELSELVRRHMMHA
jgi:hypothetical protein